MPMSESVAKPRCWFRKPAVSVALIASLLACASICYRNSMFPAYRDGRIESIEYLIIACLSTAIIALEHISGVRAITTSFLRHHVLIILLPLFFFVSVYKLSMYQFGGFDESEIAHAAAYFAQGLRSYIDFPVTMPPLFVAGIRVSVLFGLKWASTSLLSAAFSAVTSLWALVVFRYANVSFSWAFFLTLVIELSTMFIAPFWWFNNTTSVAAVLLLVSTLACLQNPDRIFPWFSLSLALALVLTSKPNVAPACLMVLILFPGLPKPTWIRTLSALAAAGAIAFCICNVAQAPVAAVLASYAEISHLRGNPLTAFAYQQMGVIDGLVAFCLLLLCSLFFIDLFFRTLAAGRNAWARAVVCLIAALTSILMDLMNAEVKVTDLIPMIVATAFLILQRTENQTSRPEIRAYLAGLLTVFGVTSFFFGITHLRILGIGEGKFYEPLPTTTIKSGYFAGLEASPRLLRVIDDTGVALATYPSNTVFFGPRMEFEYPVFHKKPMPGMPLIWDAGVTFSPARLPGMIASFKAQDPDLLIFVKADYTRMGLMGDYIKTSPDYQRIDSFKTLTVYVRKR